MLWILSSNHLSRGATLRTVRLIHLSIMESRCIEGVHPCPLLCINGEEKGMGNERTMRGSMQHRDVQQDSAFATGHLFAVMHLPGLSG